MSITSQRAIHERTTVRGNSLNYTSSERNAPKTTLTKMLPVRQQNCTTNVAVIKPRRNRVTAKNWIKLRHEMFSIHQKNINQKAARRVITSSKSKLVQEHF